MWAVLDVFAYMPLAFLAAVSTSLGFRNLFHRKTTDKDVDNGNYATWYRDMTVRDKVWLISIQWIAYVIAGALIALGLLIVLAGLPSLAPS